MLTIGFPISDKINERRRALIPKDIENIRYPNNIFIEEGYGSIMGYTDNDFSRYGVNICNKEKVLMQNCVCDPKIGDASYLRFLKSGQIIFGYIHAVQNQNITDVLLNNKLTAIAWEDMYDSGRHVFWRNNEIAGEAAVMHAYSLYGALPYETKVALIGKGNTARGALKILTLLGADVRTYDRNTEKLLREELSDYDVIVNAILWDVKREDHIIYKSDLSRMKKKSMIIDISCDKNGGIESSVPTNFTEPVYNIDGVMHYAVDHTPTMFYKTATRAFSEILPSFLNALIDNEFKSNPSLNAAIIIEEGLILDKKILDFQNRKVSDNEV